MEPTTGIILTGGQSSRMGTDKALIKWKGITFLERIISNLEPVCRNILIVGERPEYHGYGVEVIPDLIENVGPLGGILTGLKHSDHNTNFFLPCDMPFLGPELIENILESSTPDKAVIPYVNGQAQLLSAVYPKTIGGHLEQMLHEGTRKVSLFVESLDIHKFTVENKDIDQFKNINFKKELDKLNHGDQS